MPFPRYLVGIKPSFLSMPTYFSGLDYEIQNCLKASPILPPAYDSDKKIGFR